MAKPNQFLFISSRILKRFNPKNYNFVEIYIDEESIQIGIKFIENKPEKYYRNIKISSPEGKIDESMSKDMNDAYENVKVTCKLSKEDRQKSIDAMDSKTFSLEFDSNNPENCTVEGLKEGY